MDQPGKRIGRRWVCDYFWEIDPEEEYIEVRALDEYVHLPSLRHYAEWTRVSKFLGNGLVGVERRECQMTEQNTAKLRNR